MNIKQLNELLENTMKNYNILGDIKKSVKKCKKVVDKRKIIW